MATIREIVTFSDDAPPPGRSPWVGGAEPGADVAVAPADPAWPIRYAMLARLIGDALGDDALGIEHVGSTSVPGLAAKPVIDIDLTVHDSAAEARYVPALERLGFCLTIREPWWYEHRCLRLDEPRCNLHVFSPGSPEVERHRIFRDWLRTHPEDLARYAEAKLRASAVTARARGHVMDYNAAKQPVVREIYRRAFRGLGLLA